MNHIKRMAALLTVLILLMLPQVRASGQTGSISVRMTHGGHAVSGGSITLYRIASLSEDWCYVPVPEFSSCGIDLSGALSPADAEFLSDYAEDIPGQTRELDSDGFTDFSPLEPGLYLLVQREAGRGYLPVKPFFVGLPQQIAGELHYRVDASPKCAPVPETPDPPGIPQTGLLRWPVPVMTALGLCLLVGGLLLHRKEPDA